MNHNKICLCHSDCVTTVYRFDNGYITRIFINDRVENSTDFSIIAWKNSDSFPIINSIDNDKSNCLYLRPSQGDYVVYHGIKYIGKEDLYKLQQVVERENIESQLERM